MTYRGHVQNGVVVLEPPCTLPEGAEVKVELVPVSEQGSAAAPLRSLYERLEAVVGAASGLPADAAMNVDHYLYGHPRS